MGDLAGLAQLLQSQGRGKDTILAHITPKEAARLKAAGGRGSRNPKTGLLEFDDTGGELTDVTPTSTYISTPTVSDAGGGGGQISSSPAPQDIGPAPATTSTDVSAPAFTNPDVNASASSFGLPGQSLTPPPASLQGDTFTGYGSQLAPTGPIDTSDLTQGGVPSINAPTDATKTAKGVLDKLGLTGEQAARLGIAGAGGIFGVLQNRKAAKEIGQAQGQEQALAQPYQEQGRQLIGEASSGILSPASMQAYRAAQAQLAQRGATTGGVGVQQAATQLESLRQQLLANQYNQGLQISQIGDKIALGAIQTGMQLDQQLNQTNQAFYTQLAQIAAGVPFYTPRT
jgi:hypothetical protein